MILIPSQPCPNSVAIASHIDNADDSHLVNIPTSMVQYATTNVGDDKEDDDDDGDGARDRASAIRTRAGEEDGSAGAASSSLATEAAAVIGFSPDDNSYYDFRGQAVRADDGPDRPHSEMMKGVFLRGVRSITLYGIPYSTPSIAPQHTLTRPLVPPLPRSGAPGGPRPRVARRARR